MTGRDNVDAQWSEDVIEEEDSLRTVNCLRGRLVAERLASRNATMEAEQLEIKLAALETQLKEEAKSRNRAERKLKLLIKRLESKNIVQELKENAESPKGPVNLQQNDSQLSLWSLFHDSSTNEGSSASSNEHPISSTVGEPHSRKPIDLKPNQMWCGSRPTANEQRDFSNYKMGSSSEELVDQEDDRDSDSHADNPMAIVSVEMPEKIEICDPEVVNVRVKQVLESLQRAKEQLLGSMERKRLSLIQVG